MANVVFKLIPLSVWISLSVDNQSSKCSCFGRYDLVSYLTSFAEIGFDALYGFCARVCVLIE